MDYKQVNDYEVIYMIKENDEEARNLLIRKYKPIINKISNKYISSVKPFGVEIDDLVQEGMIALNKAINTFNDDNSVLFYTYASVCVERQIITYCTRTDSKKNYCLNHSYFDERYYCIGDEKNLINNFLDEHMTESDFTLYKNLLDIKCGCVFELRYNGFTYKEISKLLDISIGTVDARLNKIRRILQKKCKFQC